MNSAEAISVAPPRPTSGRLFEWTKRLFRALAPWLVPIAALGAWQLVSLVGLLPGRLVPSPLDVARAAVRLTISGELARHVTVSARRALLGFLIGGTVGLGLGVLNGLSARAETLFDTTLQMARAIPHLALVPLLILWLGIGEIAKVALVALGVVFPLYINTVHGLRSVDPRLIELGRVHGLGTLALLRRIILPGALPSILIGVRYGLGLMWLGLIVAETISAESGIGYLAMNAREFLQTDVVLLSILLYAALGKLADVATRLLEYWLLPWRRGSSGGGVRLAARGLEHRYGDRLVLDRLNLDVSPGEFLAVVGRSGSGKTTLLRLLAGLEVPSKGELLQDGVPIAGLNRRARLMFQDARLLPWARVAENVGLGLPRDRAVRVERALELVYLSDRSGDWPEALSGGQKQRVALARALAADPGLLLLDEPLGALDALTRIEMQSLLERTWLEAGSTAVLVTHDVEEAVTLADRVIAVENGRITLELPVPLERPRPRDSPPFAALAATVLGHVLGGLRSTM
jgi:sulfonate transport system permease protein